MKALLLAALLGQGEVASNVVSLRERERVARLELEAAKSKEFYLLADAASLTLSLKLAGVPLATYKLESIELGLPPLPADEAPPRRALPLPRSSSCTGRDRARPASVRRRPVRTRKRSRPCLGAVC
jgi:hypothetical protein